MTLIKYIKNQIFHIQNQLLEKGKNYVILIPKKIINIGLFIVVSIFIFPTLLFAGRYFKVLDNSVGLPSNNTVTCIAQDKQGFVWFGTYDGLCRFDGVKFSIFRHNPKDRFSILNNNVRAILSVNDGLWLGTLGGLNFYSYKDGQFHPCMQRLSTGKVKQMKEHVNSIVFNGRNIFVLDLSGKIFVWKGNYYFEQCYRNENSFYSISPYKNGLILALKKDGLYLLSPDKKSIISKFTYKASLPSNNLYYSKKRDLVYVGSGIGNSSYVFKIKNNCIEKSNAYVPQNLKAVIDRRQETFFGTDGNGLIAEDGNGPIIMTPQNSNLSSDAIYSLFVDSDNNLWIGTYRGGVDLYSDRYNWFKSLTKGNGALTHNMVTAVCTAGNLLYLGLDGGGLDVYDTKTDKVKSYTTANSNIGGNNILSLSKDEGNMWMGIYGKGLGRFSLKNKSFKIYSLPPVKGTTDSNNLWQIKDDNEGSIWVLGPSVFVFNKKAEVFMPIFQLYGCFASGMIIDGNDIWISTYGNGIYKLNKQTRKIIKHYSKKSNDIRLINNSIRYIFMDSKHHLWFYAEYAGLYMMDERLKKITSYGIDNGLTDPNVVAIEEDKVGNLWMGTYNGLFCFDSKSGTFVRFEKEDNLSSSQFNYNASYQDGGIMYFGSTKGLICFNPAIVQYNQHFNQVSFTQLELLNNEKKNYYLYGNHPGIIRLFYNQNFFTIHFSVPELISPNKVRFSCYMKNFEKNWQELSYNRQVSYTNVPPGEYMFYVRSTDSKGRWGKLSCLKILISPPWWKTTCASILWIFLAFSIIYMIFWFYFHELKIKHIFQIKEMEKDKVKIINEGKMNFYTNITHELRTPIFLITAPLEELLRSGKGLIQVPKSYLSAIYRNAMKLNKLISRIIDFRKLESGKLKLSLQHLNVISFCRNLTDDYEAICLQKNIVFHFLFSKTIIQLDFDPEKLESILSNLVSNAFKYTPEGGIIKLIVDDAEYSVIFTVEDNGIGIEKEFHDTIFDSFFRVDASQKETWGDGIGLSFVKHLVELHGGTIKVESELNKGSKFIFNIPKISTEEKNKEFQQTCVLLDVNKEEFDKKNDVTISSPAATHSILIIDDEKETVEILERFLIADFKIFKANNGVDGLTLAQETLPDIIICDIMMPKMSGIEFLDIVKNDKKLSHIQVIMFTAKTSEDDMIDAFDCGADAYLTKPISLKYLRRRIDRLLAQSESVNVTNLISKSDKSYTKEEQHFLLKCKEIIDDNLTNADFDIVVLADKMGMSHSSLYKKIKSMTGLSLIEFINEYKIFKAVQYFKEGETNIETVCVKCGFNDIKNFREMFKRKIHITPKQYVQQL
jgi:DNA-binding response OmpR family regulator/ligand-binding sensor domain-containing protein/two-component sensor histidine kinase